MKPGDVVLVPFPYTDRAVTYRRPALVIAGPMGDDGNALLWVLMITGENNRPWPGDVSLGDLYPAAGLVDPSVVRTAKSANVEMRKRRHSSAACRPSPWRRSPARFAMGSFQF